MMENKTFRYNGCDITFQIGNGDMMVNATEMAKPFNKYPWKWLELPSTKEYIEVLSENRSLAVNQLVRSVRGGRNTEFRGNWFHEDLAMEFARWLSPMFAIWCNDRLKELMKYGFTATDDMLEALLANPELSTKLFSKLKEEREKNSLALQNEKEISEIWREDARICDYYMREAFDSSNFYQMKARRYFNLTLEYLKLLKENNVKIPPHLKLYRINYAQDLLRLRN